MATEQEKFWRGSFGDEYVARNQINWRARIPFWHDIMNRTEARFILEVGCNVGSNLKALREVDHRVRVLRGCDINKVALAEAKNEGLSVVEASILELGNHFADKQFDLVFTAGVLIHVAPNDIERAMRSIIATSKKYILAIEYADEKETEIEYRGHSERLWRRPFGKLYEKMGLTMAWQGDAGGGFDNCHAWLMERA